MFWVEILRTYILGVRFWVFWVLAGCLGWSFYVQIGVQVFSFSGILRLGFDWVHFGGVCMYTLVMYVCGFGGFLGTGI